MGDATSGKTGGDAPSAIRKANEALENNKDFRDWFHRWYKAKAKSSDKCKKNPNMSPDEVADAFDLWKRLGKLSR